MNDLCDKFLKIVTSSSNSHVVIADVDRLLEYSEFREALIDSGYRIVQAKNGLEARIKFELEIRDTPDSVALVVPGTWDILPDILENVYFVELGLNSLIPKLNSEIIGGLRFEALELLSNEKQYAKLNEDQTLAFVFKTLYSKDLHTLSTTARKEYVLSGIIDILLESGETNSAVLNRLTSVLKRHFPWVEWELKQDSLLCFLQEQWERFLSDSTDLDFNDPQLRKAMADLFLTDRLTPVKIEQEKCSWAPQSLSIGYYLDLEEYKEQKFASLLDRIEEAKGDSSNLDYWRQLIGLMAAAALCSFESVNAELQERYSRISKSANDRFQDFIESEYDKLFSLSGVRRPATVSHVLDHIRFHMAPRKALMVLDGVNLWQWAMIAGALESEGLGYRSDVLTAFIPSITAWSRQAIFKGSMPDLSADNSKEEKLFRSYWVENGYQNFEIGFEKVGFGNNPELLCVSEKVKILGIVSNDLDELMHSALMGNRHLQSATAYWLKNSSFISGLKKLKEIGFVVFITTDHGSVEARGVRNLKLVDKLGSISRGKRHSHFRNQTMLENFKSANPSLDIGTRDLSIFLKNDEAFTNEGDLVVTHGGSHFWEVLIPFAQV